MHFEHEWPVRFGQVDQAGIIYYPELFDAFHHGVEALLESVDLSLHELVVGAGRGMPIVHAEADFLKPIRYGARVRIEIRVTLSDSSLTFTGAGYNDDDKLFSVLQKHAMIDMETFESIPVPEEIRSALDPYVTESTQL